MRKCVNPRGSCFTFRDCAHSAIFALQGRQLSFNSRSKGLLNRFWLAGGVTRKRRERAAVPELIPVLP